MHFFKWGSSLSFISSISINIPISIVSIVESIVIVICTKFLGVIVNDKLYLIHLQNVSCNTGVLAKLRALLHRTLFSLNIYNTLIWPYINYHNIAYGHAWATANFSKATSTSVFYGLTCPTQSYVVISSFCWSHKNKWASLDNIDNHDLAKQNITLPLKSSAQ